MSDQELKRYILTHRDDQEAFHAYMARRHARPHKTVVQPDDPNWEEKLIAGLPPAATPASVVKPDNPNGASVAKYSRKVPARNSAWLNYSDRSLITCRPDDPSD